MTELVFQIVLTLTLVISVALGESVSARFFGVLKNAWLYILDVVAFVTVIVLVLNAVYVEEIVMAVPVYFISGFLAIIAVRGATTFLGFKAEELKKRSEFRSDQAHYIKNLKRNLERYQLDSDEIKEVLINSGFKRKDVDNEFRN